MTLKQKMRKQHKKNVISKYKHLRWWVNQELFYTLNRDYVLCTFKLDFLVPVYLVAIELEKQGYKCEIEKPLGDESYFNIHLLITW